MQDHSTDRETPEQMGPADSDQCPHPCTGERPFRLDMRPAKQNRQANLFRFPSANSGRKAKCLQAQNTRLAGHWPPLVAGLAAEESSWESRSAESLREQVGRSPRRAAAQH